MTCCCFEIYHTPGGYVKVFDKMGWPMFFIGSMLIIIWKIMKGYAIKGRKRGSNSTLFARGCDIWRNGFLGADSLFPGTR
jgi:hypothetical protein